MGGNPISDQKTQIKKKNNITIKISEKHTGNWIKPLEKDIKTIIIPRK